MREASASAEASYVLGTCRAGELEAPGALAARWLQPAERARWEKFPTEKRRLDWLAGRVAAKRAAAARLGLDDARAAEVQVLSDQAGRPFLFQDGEPLPVAISISHCALGGVAAASAGVSPIGCDWEVIEPREPRVLELFAHEDERAFAPDASAQTRLWARKEAVLKLLGVGLGVDPRDVRFLDGMPKPEFHGAAAARWRELGSPTLSFYEQFRDGSWLAVAFQED